MISVWIIAAFAIVGVLVVLGVIKGITQELENPGEVAEAYSHDDPATRSLNIITNLLFALSGIIFMIAGYPVEAMILFLLTMASTFWHGVATSAWRIADHVFCLVAAVIFLGVFFRIVCINGWPLLSILYIALILGGAYCFSVHSLHIFWHVLVSMFVFALGIEIMYSPGLIPNKALRDWILRNLRRRIKSVRDQDQTVMIADLFRKTQSGSMIMN